jgi:TonB family protein
MGFKTSLKVTVKIPRRSAVPSTVHPQAPRFYWPFPGFLGIICGGPQGAAQPRMFELKTSFPQSNRHAPDFARSRSSRAPKQRRVMAAALTLLLITLGFVLYRDRDFWFPEAQLAEDQPPTSAETAAQSAKARSATHKKSHGMKTTPKTGEAADLSTPPPITATTARAMLPPLEVEVVAGNFHRTLYPSTKTVELNLQPNSPPQAANVAAAAPNDTAADVTNNAAEHVQMSVDTAEVVNQPAKPDYPLLARQMKVQGSVILQALISRDGLIQDLRVVSGPPILASAAQEAVKQWHFKPHFKGASPVETQAKITVNFTISTN